MYNAPTPHVPLPPQVSTTKRSTDALSFLKPFAWQLWLAIIAAMLGVAVIAGILARLSPLGRFEVRRIRGMHKYCVEEDGPG